MKIMTIVGARPQFVKAAVVSRELATRDGVDEAILHTGQHYDDAMSGRFFQELGIPEPQFNLGVGGLSHGAMTGRMLEEIERVIIEQAPTFVLVYGDTNSTLAGALAASKLHVPVAHVEAGLRSFNKKMPEELNRILTDHVSSLLFCPTQGAADQLAKEGIKSGVHVAGDVMYDATLAAIEQAETRSTIVHDLELKPGNYAVATLHRAENTDTRDALARAVVWLENRAGEAEVVLPLHPRTKQKMNEFGLTWRRVRTIEPVGYLDMTALLMLAKSVFTDSGGVQKEAYFHKVPCVTLRDETEWVETVDAGWNRLWADDHYEERKDLDVFGDGKSAKKIVDRLLS